MPQLFKVKNPLPRAKTRFPEELESKRNIYLNTDRCFLIGQVGTDFSSCKIVECCQIQNANVNVKAPGAVNPLSRSTAGQTICLVDTGLKICDRTNTARAWRAYLSWV